MPETNTTDEWLQRLREQRSSENNFESIRQTLQEATQTAQKEGNDTLAGSLKEVDEKYANAYEKAKETGGTAWPEFEKFVAQFERILTNSNKDDV